MAQPSVPLSMLLTRNVSYEWHDGVALVAQLVAQLRSDILHAQARIPDLSAVALEENGTLTLAARPDQSMPAMPGAAQVLQQLLSGTDQPAPLRLFVMQAATSDGPASLQWFADELAKWERPNRTAKLANLYTRAMQQLGPAALSSEARAREEQLFSERQQIAAATAQVSEKKKTPPPAKRSGSSTAGSIAAVLFIAALLTAGAAWYLLGRPLPSVLVLQRAPASQPTTDTSNTDEAAPAASTDKAADPQQRRRTEATRRATVATAQQELAKARDLFQRQEYAAAQASFDRVIEMLGTESSPQAQEVMRIANSLAEVSRAANAERAEAAAQEYRPGDAGVVEPVPLAFLPPKPDPNTPPDMLQVMEVHVNAAGTVDSAKFVMNRPSFRNSWWTSAAKAWKFQPATKNGKPVRFVMRIVMDDSDSQH